tara:strand:+ start:353 stop:1561 length:1209 start_codon:yes stop_codon:yes gene_type:complete
MINFLKNKKILLIVTGGIASYKALDLIRRLQDKKVDIECILTESAKKFINPITFESLLGKKVHSNLFSLSQEKEMSHIKLATEVNAILVIPCTANFIAKMANGIADDLSLNILLASEKLKIIAPAMNSNMWNNGAVKENLKFLSKINVRIFSPDKGRLACGSVGSGKLMDVNDIIENLNNTFCPKELSGVKVIVTAGASIEKIDPVRYLSNFSSGIQGYEIAKALQYYGASVILISGKTNLLKPKNIKLINASDCQDFYDKCIFNLPCDIFISAAAISDWKPKKKYLDKIKKREGDISIILKENIDILKKISNHKNRPKLVIGFSAETTNLISNSKIKLLNKNCDWIVANNVKENNVFGSNKNKVSLISKDRVENWVNMEKSQVAKKITKKIVNFFKKNKLI